MAYYRLLDKNELQPDRWYLRGPQAPGGSEIDPCLFTTGRSLALVGPLSIPLRRSGSSRDFTLADFDMPVLEREYADALAAIAPDEIQRFAARVEGSDNDYDIINILHRVRCLDESRSTVTYWTPDMGLPDMVGKYFTVSDLKIDPRLTGNKNIFRLDGWLTAIIVSQRVRDALQSATGAIFERV